MLKEKSNNLSFLEETRSYHLYAKKAFSSCPNSGGVNSLLWDSERRQLSHNFKCPVGPSGECLLGFSSWVFQVHPFPR